MRNAGFISLKETDGKKFEEIRKTALHFHCDYCIPSIIKDNIFVFIRNYIRKAERKAELMFFPFEAEDLEAVSFIRDDTVFLCLNTEKTLSEEVYASANELYRILRYIEDEESSGFYSILTQDMLEDDNYGLNAEANAFARLLLVPDNLLSEAVSVNGIEFGRDLMRDVLLVMSLFAVPFRPTVIRLYECGNISREQALSLLSISKAEVENELRLSSVGRIWQQSGKGTESLGSFIETYEYAVCNGLLPEGKIREENEFIERIKRKFPLECVVTQNPA